MLIDGVHYLYWCYNYVNWWCTLSLLMLQLC